MLPARRQILPTSAGANTATTGGVALTSGVSAGVKSTNWTQVVAATDFDSPGFFVTLRGTNAQAHILELAVGGVGAESSIGDVANGAEANGCRGQFVPISIPKGSRISAKTSADGGGTGTEVMINLIRGASLPAGCSKGTLYGVNTGVPTTVDAGTTAHTKGAYAQLTAATGRAAKAYTMLFWAPSSQANPGTMLVDLAVGAAASEIVIFSNLFQTVVAFTRYSSDSAVGPIWTPIPSGTRIAMRCQSTTTTASDRTILAGIILWE